ncbi:MAG: sporulation protein [Thermoflexibacteraceae bacterium]
MFNTLISFFTGNHIRLNTRLAQQHIAAGATLEGYVWIKNLTPKEILLKNICIELATLYQHTANFQVDKEKYVIFKAQLREKLVLNPSAICEMPFEFTVPFFMPILPATAMVNTQITVPPLQIYEDNDEIIISPHPTIKAIFDIFWKLGFKHSPLSGYIERHATQPLQIFFLKPIKEPYLGKFKDIELFFDTDFEQTHVFMTINKMTKGLAGMEREEENDNKVQFSIKHTENITTELLSHYLDATHRLLK